MISLSEELKQVKKVAIVGHVHPDGDCVGSCLGLYNYLAEWYPHIKATLYLEPIPNIFRFLKNADQINHSCRSGKSYDLCFVLDCADLGRMGEAEKYFHTAKRTLCIDHHISNQGFASENYVVPTASSTSELLYNLLEPEKITKEIAECIYLGIVHDTGVFQYSCTSEKTMVIAGNLMNKGIAFTKIVDETFYTKTYDQNRIMGKVLMESKLYLQDRVIAGVATLGDMEEFHVLPKHLDGIVSQLRVTKGVEVAIFLYETKEGFKASLRSNGKVDVSVIATSFGGGGHKMAAGVTMAGTSDEIIEKLSEAIGQQLPA